jgi:hypothetical protein
MQNANPCLNWLSHREDTVSPAGDGLLMPCIKIRVADLKTIIR